MNISKKFVGALAVLFVLFQGKLLAQDRYLDPLQISRFFGTTGSVQTDAVGSFINPALGPSMPSLSTQFDFWAFADTKDQQKIDQWGFFYADPFLLSGIYGSTLPDASTQLDVHFGLSFGNRGISFGMANISLINDQHSLYDYFHALQAGLLLRPARYASLGVTYTGKYSESDWNLLVDGGVRPLGTNLLTLFGAWSASNSFSDSATQEWLAGVSLVPMKGLELYSKYHSSGALTIGLNLRYGKVGFGTALASEQNGFSGTMRSAAGISFTSNKKGFAMDAANPPKSYVELSLKNISATADLLNGPSSLFAVLETIKTAKDDPAVAGLILNTTSLSASRSDLWELRTTLEDFKKSGKKVIAFVQRPSFDIFALATVADHIVMDSQGTLTFDGYVAGRGYFKHTLEKLGIGFRELKYFTYKSAAESYSRDSLSPADREQYEAYLDSIFNTVKQQILAGRHLTEEQFTTLLEGNFLLSPKEALEASLVDSVGREEALRGAILQLSGKELPVRVYGEPQLSFFQRTDNLFLSLPSYRARSSQQDTWGEPPHLAIVYANGETALQGGMNARNLAKIIENLGNDASVKGIILRVDSPGGDAIAADHVAEAVKKAKEHKPVYVSMGSVAGSGGYWVSMYGSGLYATPYTITGSIGVIASWFYDAGLNDKIGLSVDLIKRGSHADLQAGMLLPYRDLNQEEVEEYHQWILELYDDFVKKVAEGRKMPENKVRDLAQGRIYAGAEAVQNGLIDGIGGLQYTLDQIKNALNLPLDAELVIDEYPYPNPFGDLFAALSQTGISKSHLVLLAAKLTEQMGQPYLSPWSAESFSATMKSRIEKNGTVQALMPLDSIELLQGVDGSATVNF